MAQINRHWLFQSRIALFLLITGFLVLYHGVKIIDVLTSTGSLANIEYLQTLIRGLIVTSLLLVMMRRRFSRAFMWFSVASLIFTHYWIYFLMPDLFSDATRGPLSYLRGLILPAIISMLWINRTPVSDDPVPACGRTIMSCRPAASIKMGR